MTRVQLVVLIYAAFTLGTILLKLVVAIWPSEGDDVATYEMTWRNKWLTAEAESLDDMVRLLREAADQLQELRDAGVTLAEGSGMQDDYATLLTEDPVVAERFGFQEQSYEDANGEN